MKTVAQMKEQERMEEQKEELKAEFQKLYGLDVEENT